MHFISSTTLLTQMLILSLFAEKEKVSLLSKLFGRGKKKTPVVPPEPEKPTVEYATFSAQFPPPEWTWYQQQVDKQLRTETWVQQQMVKSGTWHYLNSLPTDSGTGSLHFTTNSVPDRISPVQLPQAHSNMNFVPGVTRRPHKKSNKQKHRSSIVIANTPQEINKDTVERGPFTNSLGQNSLRLSSLPTRLGDVTQSNFVSHPMFNSTPRYRPGQELFPEQERGREIAAEGEKKETQGRNKSHKKSHRSKRKSHQDRHSSVYPMSRHVSGMSAGNHWDEDISFEYQGQLPAKHSEVAVSHNSGVNCIGLGGGSSTGGSYQRSTSYRHTETNHKKDRVTHFDVPRENRLKNHETQRSRSYRHTVEDQAFGHEPESQTYQRSRSYRHPMCEDMLDGKLSRDGADSGVHIYANVHVSNHDVRPKLPERNRQKPPQENLPVAPSDSLQPVLERPALCDQLPERDLRSESNSERATYSSSSSQGRASQDSAVEGTESSEQSFGTVVNTHLAENKHADRLAAHLCDMTLGDSGFSSPRTSENHKESRKSDSTLTKEQNMCNQIKTDLKLNNSVGKPEECSGDSLGRITSDTLYENVKINHNEVLNNMRYLHKEINVSSQNLTRQASGEDVRPPGMPSSEMELESKQTVVKKFNFSGDFHVVGVV